jgi:hypothetical protein
MGDGPLVVPVAVVIRRPDPVGPGRPGRAQRTWWPGRRERTWAVLPRRCRGLPAPGVVAARGLGEAAWRGHVHTPQQGTLVVEGTRRAVCSLPEARRVTGADLRTRPDWPWRDSPQARGRREARLTATRATYGRVTRGLVDTPGAARFDVRCQETRLSAPRLIRAWGRRSGMEPTFRTLKPLWAAEACPVQTEDADDGHLGLRLWAGLGWLDTARCCGQGRVTREAIVCSLKHHWRFLNSAPLE